MSSNTVKQTHDTTKTINASKEDFDIFLSTKLKSGDEKAFMYLFTRWNKPLYQFIKNLTGSGEDAEDICQETFTTLWLSHSTIDPNKNIKSYIFNIAKHAAWKHLRENKRRKDLLSETGLTDADHLSPEHVVQLKEMELLTEYAISILPSRTREIYKLYYIDNLSYEQIAVLPELAARFNGWLTDGLHCREKSLIMRKVFYEILSDGNPEQPDEILTERRYDF